MPASLSGDNAVSPAHNHNQQQPNMTSLAAQASTDLAAKMPLDSRRQKRIIDKKSWEYNVRTLAAGGLAGCAAKTVVGPLDRVKILFQASNPQFQKYTGSWFGVVKAIRDIHSTSGARGLFRGHSATLLRIFPYAGIKFLAYERVRALIIRDASQETTVRRFASGAIAGMMSVLATYPLEVIRVRMAWETKSHSRSSYMDICRRIYHERPVPPTTTVPSPSSGLVNFFRGFTPTMWGMLPYAGSSFLAHDSAGDFMRQPALAPYTVLPSAGDGKRPRLKAWAEISTGAVAGFVSQTVSYPLEVIRRRMQVGGVVGDGHRLGMIEVARTIWRQTGFKGFYVGLGIGYAKVVPMTSVSFYAYDRAKLWLGL